MSLVVMPVMSNTFDIEVTVSQAPTLVNVPTNNGVDVTSVKNYLPFAGSDVFGTGLSWQTFYTGTSSISDYEQVATTYLVDPDTCLFYSNWGLKAPGTTYHSTCGSGVRIDMN